MNNHVSIKQTNNGFIIYLNEYKNDPCLQGVWVARNTEELSSILVNKVYPAFGERINNKQ